MKKFLLLLASIFILISCATTVGKVSERNENGKFEASKTATTIKNLPIDLDAHKSLLIVPNDKFMVGMAENLKYFDKVQTFEDFEKEIIKAEKQAEVGSLSGRIGLSNAYNNYKPFLYLKFDDNDEKTNYLQLKLVNPKNAEELFISEIKLDFVWAGVHDKNTFNPLFNDLIHYIKSNSKTYN